MRAFSLKARLGLASAALGLAALLAAGLLVAGMAQVSTRLDEALGAERRLQGYAALSTQVSTFLVVATEMVQTDTLAETRAARTDDLAETVRQSFAHLRAGLDSEVTQAQGLDAQSRRATQSLAIARMEALFRSSLSGLLGAGDKARLRAHLDTFAAGFEPLLGEAVKEETRLRADILGGIDRLRHWLTLLALAIGAAALLLALGVYFGLVRPQFARLDALLGAARRIKTEDFAVALPEGRADEIGRLAAETNRMARALAARAEAVAQDRADLNDTIAARTAALSAANTRLERADEDRRRFFADISHELRTPLTVILMEAQLGRQGAEPLPSFATIEARAQRLNRRIDDLLRVARSETGQLALDPAPVDLAALLAEVAAETKAELASAGMTLTLSPAPLSVTVDRNWLRQVLVGLLRNAIRHARSGGAVTLSATASGGMAQIEVSDLGPGIAPQDQARIWDHFAQGGSGNAQGFGLGLALAAWVIEAQGGTISVTSPVADGRGTRITTRLPLTPR
ncbi:HAMP domain-containing sensor histidine kinase [Salipiger sp. 1_MG-2023]|uniref:sensor histidine kinase n=1 Tax=Salipiger sp. 1_MG-2023 TaxID=3062665 RepID=UPI0026E450AC|nr:HAMP domain-containing sensor histidine kinase [Salipiger sp. 1_MG-2023]MDO6585333.1 HAMP domain-containing sensor histidine kinase [Salipiger sp. 1_MG-2023]